MQKVMMRRMEERLGVMDCKEVISHSNWVEGRRFYTKREKEGGTRIDSRNRLLLCMRVTKKNLPLQAFSSFGSFFHGFHFFGGALGTIALQLVQVCHLLIQLLGYFGIVIDGRRKVPIALVQQLEWQ